MSDNTSNNIERTYFLRTICMYMDLTKDTLLQLFRHLIKSENITEFLTDKDTKAKLRDMFKNSVLNKKEYTLVSSTWPEPEKFDIALLIRLILGLCRDRILGPQLGWHTNPQPMDTSLGADLLRLRNTRNKLIGHRESAKLDEAEYIHIFNKMEVILLRVFAAFDRGKMGNIKKTFCEYKDLYFETENGKMRRYLNELAEADNETKRLQSQVEELLKKSKEFQTFFKTTPERFVRYLKLLFDGGGTALRGILERELRKDKSLDFLISENKEILLQTIQEEYHHFLFPQGSGQIDHNCWDIGLLASVILLIFTDLRMDEINKIEELKAARQNYAMHAISCLDADEFLEIWTDLISSLKHLSMGIEEGKKLYIENLIVRYKKRCNEGDADDYLDQLRKAGAPVKTLECVYNEYMYQLAQRLRQLKERGLQFKCEHDLELKIMISCEDEEKKRNAEDVLEKKLRASLLQSHDGDSFLQMETDRFMSSITSHPNITPTGITRCCIMITFTCSTLDGVMHLLDYLSSQDFLKRICNISNELSYLYEDTFLVQGYITLESLSSIQTADSQKHDSEKGISLPLKCSSIEGMEHLLDTVQNVKTANTLNSIADKISEKLEETVFIHVTTNLFDFRDVFNDAGAQDLRSKRCSGGVQALKKSSSNESYGSLESIPESLELLKVSGQEDKEVMENVTNKQVSVMQSDFLQKFRRRQRKKFLTSTIDEESNTDEDSPTNVDYTFPYRPTRLAIQDKSLHDASFDQRLVHSLGVGPKNVTVDDAFLLDKMLRRLSYSDFTFDHLLQLERAESTLREIEAPGIKVTSEDLNDLQTDIESLFHSLQVDESSSTSVKRPFFSLPNNHLDQRPFSASDELRCKERLKCLYQEFVTFKRHIMPKVVSEDEDYQGRKQELKDFLITTHRKTLKEKRFNKKISMIFGPGRLMSPKTGIVTSYRGIFYDDYHRKQHKHIHIIGDEGRASTVCLELVSAWCEAQSETNVHILKNFEFVFMISLSDVGSDDSINEMIRLLRPGEEYGKTLDQVLQLEPDKCLVILDGLEKWRLNTYNMHSALEFPKGSLFSDYVILFTTSRRLKNRINREFGDKQLLYIC
ncbi:uncharacterized protein LOC132753560 [Ruditapes philippinarum]|uniref:uncharacterized protein LOC132753560 n=1 Tax=Ruditapes philippinarum TaxID=129788 RepID=UPI00295AB6E6|nr:uncharacterized protein LOC132753560 [Ruditapes philippinarum]